MAKHITPIERAIAGEPSDRRRRHELRQAEMGIKRVAVRVHREHVEFFQMLAVLSRLGPSETWASIMADPLDFMSGVKRRLAKTADRPQRLRREDGPQAPQAHP